MPAGVTSMSWRRRSSSSGRRDTRPRPTNSLMLSVSDCTRTCIRVGQFGGGDHAGPADLAEHLHLAQRQSVVGSVPAHLPGQSHHRFPQLGGGGPGACSVITKLYLG